MRSPWPSYVGVKEELVAAQTEPVALSQNGDVRISTRVSVPEACADPIVLVRERYEGKIGGWLAATGK